MKFRLVLFARQFLALVAMACNAVTTCRILRPTPTVLAVCHVACAVNGLSGVQCRDRDGCVDLEAIPKEHLVDDCGQIYAIGERRKVSEQREVIRADLVSMLVSAGREGVIGIGDSLENGLWDVFLTNFALIPSFGDWAYSICSIDITGNDHSILYEIGHNMGCGHFDRRVACRKEMDMDLGFQCYPYSMVSYVWIGSEGYHHGL